ncbi:MAG: hypothetical protein NVS9B1_11570 [Candidatus Dormibacteraceae bacterium]
MNEAPRVRTDDRAKAALLFGLVSLLGLFLPLLLAAGVAGIYLGWTARGRIKASPGELRGAGIAVAGIGLGILGSLLSLALPAVIIYGWAFASAHGGRLPY